MQEQFSYSLMASGLGILIVFLILVLLSVLMVIIRKLSHTDKTGKPATVKKRLSGKSAKKSEVPLPVLVAVATAASSAEAGTPNWVAAAAAAYLASEDDDAVAPRASNWAVGGYNTFDPWVNNNKLSK